MHWLLLLLFFGLNFIAVVINHHNTKPSNILALFCFVLYLAAIAAIIGFVKFSHIYVDVYFSKLLWFVFFPIISEFSLFCFLINVSKRLSNKRINND